MILEHVVASIGPPSRAHGDAAAAHVASAAAPLLERLARSLGGAQHAPRPRATPRKVVIVAGDHGCADPGIAMGADHPTATAAAAIAAGTAAVAHVARTGRAPIVLVDAGVREPAHLPAIAIRLAPGRPSRDLAREAALTAEEARLGLDAGIALAMSLSDPADACLAIGAIGLGAEVAAAALLGAATGIAPTGLGDAAAEAAGARGAALAGASALELLAAFGGPETCVLAGLILGAASIDVPVILDGYATAAAALIAARLAPDVRGYLIAAHRGPLAIVEALALAPVFEVGLGHGDGTGAAMILPLVDQVAAIAARS